MIYCGSINLLPSFVGMNKPVDAKRRSYWLKTLHEWHWISSALCLVGILFFSITGVTLNHSAQIEASPEVIQRKAILPDELRTALAGADSASDPALPAALREWISKTMDVEVGARIGEWSEDEIYVSMPRAGGDAWLSIDCASGAIEYEKTDRGWSGSTICTRAATPERHGPGSSMCLRWPAWCFPSAGFSCCKCMPANGP